MKKRLWILAVSFIALGGNTQTKDETEAWILKQAAVNPPALTYRIEGGEMISELSYSGGASSLGAPPVQKAVPLGKVTRISYLRTEKFLSYSLMCDVPCAYLLDEPEPKQPRFLFEIYQNVDANFPPRMNKALLQLIALHGSKASISEEQAPKEAF